WGNTSEHGTRSGCWGEVSGPIVRIGGGWASYVLMKNTAGQPDHARRFFGGFDAVPFHRNHDPGEWPRTRCERFCAARGRYRKRTSRFVIGDVLPLPRYRIKGRELVRNFFANSERGPWYGEASGSRKNRDE